MQATNCPRCGRLFTQIRSPICAACEKADEEAFTAVKNYIEENPHCLMGELSEATQVPVKRITQYIRDGRLEISKGMVGEITCDKCGKPIKRGRYCDTCAVVINRSVNDMFGKTIRSDSKDGANSSHKMHTTGKTKIL